MLALNFKKEGGAGGGAGSNHADPSPAVAVPSLSKTALEDTEALKNPRRDRFLESHWLHFPEPFPVHGSHTEAWMTGASVAQSLN